MSKAERDMDKLNEKYIPIPESGCWIWIKYTDELGYGILKFRNKNSKAHRVSWILHNGEIPEGLQINHKCNVRSCINPAHLYVGTQKENMEDMRKSGNHTQARGEKINTAKLTEKDAIEIFKSKESTGALTAKYNVSRYTIWEIRKRKTWKHVNG